MVNVTFLRMFRIFYFSFSHPVKFRRPGQTDSNGDKDPMEIATHFKAGLESQQLRADNDVTFDFRQNILNKPVWLLLPALRLMNI